MTRLPLFRQLLLLQMLVVVVIVAFVAGVSLVQSETGFRRVETRRLLGAAESLATERLVRDSLTGAALPGSRGEQAFGAWEPALEVELERVRASTGATYALMVPSTRSTPVGTFAEPHGSDSGVRPDVAHGASWAGEDERYGRQTIEAQVAVLSDRKGSVGRVLGFVVIGRNAPTRGEIIGTTARSAFIYLALAGLVGVLGSLLIARRVKRQTLGLEPREITALVEQREAMLHGVREGVVGVDRAGVVAFVNDEAIALLDLAGEPDRQPVSQLGVPPEVESALIGDAAGEDVVVAVGSRLLVLNTQPVRVRQRQTGWVTSMRDRTELLSLEQELAAAQAGTDTLRAQVHEFRNRLHAISGMAELGRTDVVRDFVRTVISDLDGRVGQVTEHVADPAVASLVVAKASRAAELGITFTLAERSRLRVQPAPVSADLVTVVGNLVDNAFDAVSAGGWVEVLLEDRGGRVVVEVADSGRGIDQADAPHVFDLGWTTKTGADQRSHGFGLALTRMACRRYGGTVTIGRREGAVLRAELFPGGAR
ncbi:ATP-binding protein [Nocardioides maradonensis]